MSNEPRQSRNISELDTDAVKPDELTEAEWAAIQQARAEVAAGHFYTQEEVEAWLREHQAARRRKRS